MNGANSSVKKSKYGDQNGSSLLEISIDRNRESVSKRIPEKATSSNVIIGNLLKVHLAVPGLNLNQFHPFLTVTSFRSFRSAVTEDMKTFLQQNKALKLTVTDEKPTIKLILNIIKK